MKPSEIIALVAVSITFCIALVGGAGYATTTLINHGYTLGRESLRTDPQYITTGILPISQDTVTGEKP